MFPPPYSSDFSALFKTEIFYIGGTIGNFPRLALYYELIERLNSIHVLMK